MKCNTDCCLINWFVLKVNLTGVYINICQMMKNYIKLCDKEY